MCVDLSPTSNPANIAIGHPPPWGANAIVPEENDYLNYAMSSEFLLVACSVEGILRKTSAGGRGRFSALSP
jgi:hypothetical protein